MTEPLEATVGPEFTIVEVDILPPEAVAPEPVIMPSTVARSLTTAAIAQGPRLEIGIDPESKEPVLRTVETSFGTFTQF